MITTIMMIMGAILGFAIAFAIASDIVMEKIIKANVMGDEKSTFNTHSKEPLYLSKATDDTAWYDIM